MTKEQEDKIIVSRLTLWAIPKKPSCLFDEVIVNIARNPELALKQNIVENNNNFWRKTYEQGEIIHLKIKIKQKYRHETYRKH